MPDPFTGPINFGDISKPSTEKANIDWLGTIAKEQLNKMLGYNLGPDAGYEFQNIWNSGSQGKPTTLSWFNGLAIDNTSIHDVATAELTNSSSLNLYVPKEGFQNTVIDTEALVDPKDTSQQKPYLDSNFKLNLGDSAAMKAANMIGTVLNGQGIGLENDPAGGLTPVSSFDLRSSLAGRILGGTGAINDTPIGLIGAQQLARALQNNVLFGLQKETVGRINLNPLSLITGNDLFTPNYEITVPKGALGKVLDFASRVTGFEIPISLLNKDASIFRSESGLSTRFQNEELLKFTSKGQKNALKENLGQNKYTPQYDVIDIPDSGYDALEDTLEPKELNDKKWGSSVIDPNGMVRVSPLKRNGEISDDPKKFMLSLENLAWNDHIALLPDYEVGPGDLLSGHKGRIMWFPPYDIKFNETVSARWTEEEFIGRGEPIYTYNNTTRQLHLSFKIVVDHSSSMNGVKKPIDKFTKVAEDVKTNETPPPVVKAPTIAPLDELSFYFANASSTEDRTYEDGLDDNAAAINRDVDPAGVSGGKKSTKTDSGLHGLKTTHYVDNTDFGLNVIYNSKIDDFISKLKDKEDTKNYYYNNITIEGYTSSPGNNTMNTSLGQKRADAIKAVFTAGGIDAKRVQPVLNKVSTAAKTQTQLNSKKATSPDSKLQKEDRKVVIKFVADPNRLPEVKPIDKKEDPNNNSLSEEDKAKIEQDKKDKTLKELKEDIISDRFIDEREYFNYLEKEDKFIFESIEEKLKYFHPAFHSTTPEGLNGRLTFLHQCTRQGHAIGDADDPKNLVFGRPPICILRVGDFYYTKVVINSLNIGYEPLVWDINKEGIGLQPMIANIDLNMNIIGGASMVGPLNRLQNALSFNYYANTEIYDNRSDLVMKGGKDDKGKTKYYILNGVLSQYDDESTDTKLAGIKNYFKKTGHPSMQPIIDQPTGSTDTNRDNTVSGDTNAEVIVKTDNETKKTKWIIKFKNAVTGKSEQISGQETNKTTEEAKKEADEFLKIKLKEYETNPLI